MDPTIILFILEKLITLQGYWFWALKAITGEDPVPAADRDMTQHWLQWGVNMAMELIKQNFPNLWHDCKITSPETITANEGSCLPLNPACERLPRK